MKERMDSYGSHLVSGLRPLESQKTVQQDTCILDEQASCPSFEDWSLCLDKASSVESALHFGFDWYVPNAGLQTDDVPQLGSGCAGTTSFA